jgi:hypothetical protein
LADLLPDPLAFAAGLSAFSAGLSAVSAFSGLAAAALAGLSCAPSSAFSGLAAALAGLSCAPSSA